MRDFFTRRVLREGAAAAVAAYPALTFVPVDAVARALAAPLSSSPPQTLGPTVAVASEGALDCMLAWLASRPEDEKAEWQL